MMTHDDDLERLLREELGGLERGLSTPHVDVARVSRIGRREKVRRTAIGVVAGAAAAAVVAVGVLAVAPELTTDAKAPVAVRPSEDRSAAGTVAGLPVGAASTAPWLGGRTVHAGGATYRVAAGSMFLPDYAAGTTTVAVRSDGQWHGLVMRDGRVREVATSGGDYPAFRLGLSADGLTVAVTRRVSAEQVDLTTYDVVSGAEAGSVTFAGGSYRDSFSVLSVNNDGRVVVSGGRFEIWTPGGETLVVQGPVGAVTSETINYPGGLYFDRTGPDGTLEGGGTFGSIDESGKLTIDGRTTGNDAEFSPSGERWVEGELADLTTASVGEADRALPLPTDLEFVEIVGWEDETHVVLEGETGSDDLTAEPVRVQVRCDVEALTCESVPLG